MRSSASRAASSSSSPSRPRATARSPVPGFVSSALRARKTRQAEARLRAGTCWIGDERDLVFRTTIGTPLDGITVTRRLQQLLSDAGLRHQRFHDMRHACASPMLAKGVAPRGGDGGPRPQPDQPEHGHLCPRRPLDVRRRRGWTSSWRARGRRRAQVATSSVALVSPLCLSFANCRSSVQIRVSAPAT
jgi:hypothetical protein